MEKKKYVRPTVYCESLVLSHHIAACDGVNVKLNSQNLETCGGMIDDTEDPLYGMTFFAADAFCGRDQNDEYIDVEGYCYTKQDNTVGFFGS